MQTVTGVFESGETARDAVARLREAGFPADDITFLASRPPDACPADGVEQAADAGRRFGTLASDVGETAVQFLPFVGRGMARGPLARAVRQAMEEGGESAGRIVGTVADGGLAATPDGGWRQSRAASVMVRAPEARISSAAAVLTAAGAVETEVGQP